MKALVHNGVVKFLLENSSQIVAQGSGIRINAPQGEPDLIVGDIPFGEVEEVTGVAANAMPDFQGDKYQYTNGQFSLIEV